VFSPEGLLTVEDPTCDRKRPKGLYMTDSTAGVPTPPPASAGAPKPIGVVGWIPFALPMMAYCDPVLMLLDGHHLDLLVLRHRRGGRLPQAVRVSGRVGVEGMSSTGCPGHMVSIGSPPFAGAAIAVVVPWTAPWGASYRARAHECGLHDSGAPR
jgi:hypothetical protein